MKRKKNILMAIGTRPEAIKMAPLYKEIKKRDDKFNLTLCNTAQHRNMIDQVLEIFNIKPEIDLDIMSEGQDLFDITTNILASMKKILNSDSYDLLLVQGDTSTTMTSALAAFYKKVKVAHVEAGLRTNDLSAPYPEEFNRQVVTKCSKWHFAPTNNNKENLINEGVNTENIIVTGNTVIDALMLVKHELENDNDFLDRTYENIQEELEIDIFQEKYLLITGHRRENFGQGFEEICKAIKFLSEKYQNIQFIYPVHLNPNVKGPVKSLLGNLKNVHLIPPLDYQSFILLQKEAHIILTDSGGVQEEAPSLGKPVVVMRELTERPEAVEEGTVILSGANQRNIIDRTSELLESKDLYNKMAFIHNPYGDGGSSSRIVQFLLEKL